MIECQDEVRSGGGVEERDRLLSGKQGDSRAVIHRDEPPTKMTNLTLDKYAIHLCGLSFRGKISYFGCSNEIGLVPFAP